MGGETRQAELDFLEILGPAMAEKIRKFIIQVILSTDMTKHFKKNDCIKSFWPYPVPVPAIPMLRSNSGSPVRRWVVIRNPLCNIKQHGTRSYPSCVIWRISPIPRNPKK